MNCPNCKIPLIMSERQGIEIDYCPECRGIWLDRGELDKIIEKSNAAENLQAPKITHQLPQEPFFNKQRNQDYYKYKGKKSWLHELFD
ncbi:MAG: zf-TFIIB domain-containing protein [Bacteroidetes bacterium]|nr:zf-TFIIB domain-containing protein [Bacteroidota bacterium]